jgi:hypothetical protein
MPLTRLPRLRPRKPKKDHTFFHRQQFNKLKPSGSPELRWYYGFDGIDDYTTIPQSDLVAGDTVEFKFVAPPSYAGKHRAFVYGTGMGMYLNQSDDLVRIDGATATLDGAILPNVSALPKDGLEHTVVLTITTTSFMTHVGSNTVGGSNANFPIYDVDVQAVSGNRFYAINDGWASNPVIADSVGGQHGTAINFNEPRWYEGV